MIEHIRVRNYRSLVDVAVDLDPLTVLIGRSGTGKSNFVSAVRLLRDLLLGRKPTQRLLGEDGWNHYPLGHSGKGQLEFEVVVRIPGVREPLRYGLSLAGLSVVHEKLVVGNSIVFHHGTIVPKSGLSHKNWVVSPDILPLPALEGVVLGKLSGIREAMIAHVALTTGIGCYDFPGNVILAGHSDNAVRSSPRRRRTQSDDGVVAGYADDGSNFLTTATGIIQNLHQLADWAAVADVLRAVNPAVRQVSLHEPERDRLDVTLGAGNALLTLDAAQESEGFRRFLAHLLALYQTPPKQTVLFEHPEHAIHPGAMTALFEEFQGYVRSGRGQVILTTHSPQLLDHFKAEQIRVVDIENQQTRIGPLAPEQVKSVREKLLFPGELLTVDAARLPGQLEEVPG